MALDFGNLFPSFVKRGNPALETYSKIGYTKILAGKVFNIEQMKEG